MGRDGRHKFIARRCFLCSTPTPLPCRTISVIAERLSSDLSSFSRIFSTYLRIHTWDMRRRHVTRIQRREFAQGGELRSSAKNSQKLVP